MAGNPDVHPDSMSESDSPERGKAHEERRRRVKDSPGVPGGTAGTGGENKVQDAEFER